MKHFAKIDTDNIVTEVIVANQNFIDSGAVGDYLTLTNHVAREYFKKLSNMGLANQPYTSYLSDSYDAGFRPSTVTGLYSDNAG